MKRSRRAGDRAGGAQVAAELLHAVRVELQVAEPLVQHLGDRGMFAAAA
jgi:hypothetical protein